MCVCVCVCFLSCSFQKERGNENVNVEYSHKPCKCVKEISITPFVLPRYTNGDAPHVFSFGLVKKRKRSEDKIVSFVYTLFYPGHALKESVSDATVKHACVV